MVDAAAEIEVLIRARYPAVYVVSWEERRVEDSLAASCTKLNRRMHVWSVTKGVKPAIPGAPAKSVAGPALPGELEILAQIHEAPEQTVFLLKDFHAYLKDTRVIRLLRDLAARVRGKAQTVIILAPSLSLPIELEKDVTVVEYGLPGRKEIEKMLDLALDSVGDNPSTFVKLEPEQREVIIKSAMGLTLDEIESAFARSLVEKKTIDIDTILEEKKQIVRKSGLLEYYPSEQQMADIGGLDILKDWLAKRTKSFTDKAKEFGIPAPKGVLLLGVQGCGKSLVAKAIAATWNLPMLKLDVGRVFGSLVGQSEENMRRAIRVAESVAPCILWMDELEKGLAGMSGSGVSDSGTTARVFSTLLTWMQEKTKPVFLVATANDVSALPPELLRKGRFDEIFFIDLPELEERKQIVSIHLLKRKRDPKKFDVAKVADQTRGFSGAEIEQVVIAALFAAFDAGREITTEDLVNEADASVPLSVMMAEEIDELRTWAQLRARPSSHRTGEALT